MHGTDQGNLLGFSSIEVQLIWRWIAVIIVKPSSWLQKRLLAIQWNGTESAWSTFLYKPPSESLRERIDRLRPQRQDQAIAEGRPARGRRRHLDPDGAVELFDRNAVRVVEYDG